MYIVVCRMVLLIRVMCIVYCSICLYYVYSLCSMFYREITVYVLYALCVICFIYVMIVLSIYERQPGPVVPSQGSCALEGFLAGGA